MKAYQFLATGLAASAMSILSCTPTQQQYGLWGAAGGGAVGAVAGDDRSDIARGIAVGALAGVGAAAYQEHRNRQNGTYNSGGDVYRQNTPPPPQQPRVTYPVASWSEIPGVVVSPHKPYNKVRVDNMKPGQLVKDPTTNMRFIVPAQR